jgi:Tfp pilus assembly protein PilN
MVTNINLSSPESEKKPALTGKSTLVVSVLLLAVAVISYGALVFLKSKYAKEAAQVKIAIEQEKQLLSGSNYADAADFQERLNLLDRIISQSFSWSAFILEFSKYVLPEVKLASFSPTEDTLPISGIASNYEAVFREINLLKKFSGAETVELKDVSEAAAKEGEQAGISFSADIKLNKKDFMKNNPSN